MTGEPKGPDYGSQPPQEGGVETKRGRRLNTLQDILNLGQDKLVVVKAKNDVTYRVAWINIKQQTWGKFVFLVFRNTSGNVMAGKIDGGWEEYLNDPMEMEVYEYTGE